MKAPLYCRCSSAPWGSVAYNKLYPSAVVQSSAGNLVDGLVDQLALGDPSGPFTGGVVADTVKQAFADEALLTDAQLYPGLDESAADRHKPHGGDGDRVHCKTSKDDCGHKQLDVEVREINPDHPEDDLDIKVSKVGKPDGSIKHARVCLYPWRTSQACLIGLRSKLAVFLRAFGFYRLGVPR